MVSFRRREEGGGGCQGCGRDQMSEWSGGAVRSFAVYQLLWICDEEKVSDEEVMSLVRMQMKCVGIEMLGEGGGGVIMMIMLVVTDLPARLYLTVFVRKSAGSTDVCTYFSK